MPDADTAVTDAGQQPEPPTPDMDAVLKKQDFESIEEAKRFNETLKADNAKYRERERLRKDEAAAASDEQNKLLQKQGRFEELVKARESELDLIRQEKAALEKTIAEISPKVDYAVRYEAMAEANVKTLQEQLTELDRATVGNLYPDFESMSMIDKEDRLKRYFSSKATAPAGPPLGGTGNPRNRPVDNAAYEAAAKRGDTAGMLNNWLK